MKSYIYLTPRQYELLLKLIKEKIMKIKNRNEYFIYRSLANRFPWAIEIVDKYVYLRTNISIRKIKRRSSGTLMVLIR